MNSKFYFVFVSSVVFLALLLGCSAGKGIQNHELTEYGTPDEEYFSTDANEEGSAVLFQAFSWESKKNGSWWNVIKNNAASIKNTFEYVWFPPISDAGSQDGYLPRELQNYKSAYGTESQLKEAINSIKPAKAIADIVINHRVGTTSWGDFTKPTFGTIKGSNYKAICSDNEGFSSDTYMNKVSSEMRGAKDTGDSYAAGRDLDHTNKDVQDGIVSWMNELNAMGFYGWRYDYVRGYNGKYVGYYNAKSNTEFSVGELWPTINSVTQGTNAIKTWVDATKESVNETESVPSKAFDFSLKYVFQNVFGQATSSTAITEVPNKNFASLGDENIFFRKYPESAVTFVDNHDTGSTQNFWALDSNDVGVAYVFILTHPGTPTVSWQHYLSSVSDSLASSTVNGTSLSLQNHIKYLISLRKALGITNTSEISVLKKESKTYAAKISGTKGNVIISIGSSNYSPNDENFIPVYSGTNFIIYTDYKENSNL